MKRSGYKKYMKDDVQKENSLLKIFVFSFFGMLIVFTFLIKSFSPSVDVSIGDYKAEESVEQDESKKIVDGRLAMIQDEDQGRSFSDLMSNPSDEKMVQPPAQTTEVQESAETPVEPQQEPVYKVFVGSYTSAEQAKVAKDIIQESGSGLNPIVKCIGSNNYTLQVGIFKNKNSAESLLYTVQQNNLLGRIVQDY